MRPPEEEIRLLVAEWIKKADLDLKAAVRLSAEGEFRDVVGFHAQQAAEKYLKALLTRHQIEFPKTHVIRRLLILLERADPLMAEALDDANWLSPFGAEIAIRAIWLRRCPATRCGLVNSRRKSAMQ
jgi:HEPN domain-containing protein